MAFVYMLDTAPMTLHQFVFVAQQAAGPRLIHKWAGIDMCLLSVVGCLPRGNRHPFASGQLKVFKVLLSPAQSLVSCIHGLDGHGASVLFLPEILDHDANC